MVTLDSDPAKVRQPLDLLAWLDQHRPPQAPSTAPPSGGNGHTSGTAWSLTVGSDVEQRAIAYLAKCDPAKSGEKGHNRTFNVACKVGPGFDLPPDVALRLLRDYFNPRCEPAWTEKQLDHKVRDAYKKAKSRGWLLRERKTRSAYDPAAKSKKAEQNKAATPDTRAQVEVTTLRHKVTREAIAAMVGDPRVFLRGDALAMAYKHPETSEKLFGGIMARNANGAPRIKLLTEATLGCLLTENAQFFKWVPVTGEDTDQECRPKDCHPPDWLIRSVLAWGEYPGFRPLLSVAECPYVGCDGSIVATPGYDEATGTLLSPAFEIGAIPDQITRTDAKEAASRLCWLVKGFPFEDGFSWTVWLTALLTASQRPMIAGSVPGFVFNANKAGCGKGLLVDMVGRLVWGGPVPTFQYPDARTESDKTVLALALGGIQAVHFDNLGEGWFYGDSSLDSALTTTVKGGRILGVSRIAEGVPLRPWWALSGNNISPGKDAYRRWLPCNLVTALEKPHERGDVSSDELVDHVTRNRGQIITDALAMLVGHAQAGRPSHGLPKLGSFEEWDGVVRAAVWFATGNDCLTTQRKAADDSPDRLSKLALLQAWKSEVPDQGSGHTANEVRKLVLDNPAAFPLMHEELVSRGQKDKPITAEKLGYVLRALKNTYIGGLKFVEVLPKRKNKTAWAVTKA
jgi:hypothetical protein